MEVFISRNGVQTGPYTVDRIHRELASGNFKPSDQAWHEALPSWTPLSTVLGLGATPAADTAHPPEAGPTQKPTSDDRKALKVVYGIVPAIVGLFIAFTFRDCAGGPPHHLLDSMIQQHLRSTRVGAFTSSEFPQFANKVGQFKILNHYTRRLGDETWHVYDVGAEVRAIEGAYDIRRRIGFVKRGSEWYSKEVRE